MNDCTNSDASVSDRGYGRTQVWRLLTEWTRGESLRKHALVVEDCVAEMGKAQADRLGLAGEERTTLVELHATTSLPIKASRWFCLAIFVSVLGVSSVHAETPAAATSAKPAGTSREASLAEYRQHLVELGAVVEACAKARDTKSCDPALAGQDDHVPLGNAPNVERRLVGYGWLRVLLTKAQEKDEAPEKTESKTAADGKNKEQDEAQNKPQEQTEDKIPDDPDDDSQDQPQDKTQDQNKDKTQDKPVNSPVVAAKQDRPEEPTRPPKLTTSQLLQTAQARLTQDIAQADAAAATPPTAPADHAPQREAMKQVLAGRDFRYLEAPTARDSMLERLSQWLNRLWASAAKLQVHAAWVGRLIVWGFIVAVCVGLVWGLMQLERRWRIRLVPESDGPAAGAASARDWQLWLKDARQCAAKGEWREAVHFVYWASISRLESKRLWPADRARTPREYLALVAAEDPRRIGLATLTGNFERTWYGGRAAAESDYLKAEELAAGLISGGGAAGSETPEGGAR
jgi:hypothetical protein